MDIKKSDEATGCSGFQCSGEGIHARECGCGLQSSCHSGRPSFNVAEEEDKAEEVKGVRQEKRARSMKSTSKLALGPSLH